MFALFADLTPPTAAQIQQIGQQVYNENMNTLRHSGWSRQMQEEAAQGAAQNAMDKLRQGRNDLPGGGAPGGGGGGAGKPPPPPRDMSKPLTVFDPYGRLQPGQRPDVGRPIEDIYADVARIEAMQPQRPTRLPGSSVQAAHVSEMQAFEEHIKCLSNGQLDALFNQLSEYRKQLEGQGPSVARNTTLSNVKMKLSKINIQKAAPKPCGTQVQTLSVPTAPLTQPAFADVDQYQACLAKQRQGAKIRCTPPASMVPGGAVPTGITVSDMPIRATGIPGEEILRDAPILDLYSTYMERGYDREADAIRAEAERALQELEQAQVQPVSVPPATAIAIETVGQSSQLPMLESAGQYSVEEALTGAALPITPDLAAEVAELAPQTVSAVETAQPSGPVAMSATAAAPTGETNWWVIAGIGAAVLLLARKTPRTKTPKKSKGRRK